MLGAVAGGGMKSAFAREFEGEGETEPREAEAERSCNKHPASFFPSFLRNFILVSLLVN